MGVFLGREGSLTGSRVPSRNRGWTQYFFFVGLRYVWFRFSKGIRLASFSGVDPVISPRTTIRSGSGSVDPDIAPRMTIRSGSSNVDPDIAPRTTIRLFLVRVCSLQ